MKRYFICGLISMMLILVMSGCQKKATPESLLQQVKKNVEGSTGIDVSMSMELRAEADEADEASYDEDLTMRYDVKASHEPEIFYIDEQLTGHGSAKSGKKRNDRSDRSARETCFRG